MALEISEGTAAKRYAMCETSRDVFLQRGRDAAELTIPTLLPPDGHSGSTVLSLIHISEPTRPY